MLGGAAAEEAGVEEAEAEELLLPASERTEGVADAASVDEVA